MTGRVSIGASGAWLDESTAGAELVIFYSRLTDIRPLEAWISAHPGVRVRRVSMDMGSGEQRERFQGLKADTGWETLPQVFINGEFVGGQMEFLAHPLARAGDARTDSSTDPRPALLKSVGYAGLVPFAAGLLMLLVDTPLPGTAAGWWLAAYGAVIATFLGAVHWGQVLSGVHPAEQAGGVMLWAVTPSLLAWLSLLLPLLWALPAQVVLFALILTVDVRLGAKVSWPGYYRRLRVVLSSAVMTILGLAWLILLSGL